jgi:predicted transposase YdaD
LSAVFASWLLQKFAKNSLEEIDFMLHLPEIPLEQTRAYREIIQRGITKGEARTLRRLLRKRFGELPVWAEEKLAAAKLDELDAWSEALLDAARLEDVFGEDGKVA